MLKEVEWWEKILHECTAIENELLNLTDYKKIGQLNKRLGKMSEARELAEKAKLLTNDNIYLLKFGLEDFDSLTIDEMVYANNQNIENLYQKYLSLIPTKSSEIRKLIIEIAPGVGGDEASLFVENLLSMYEAYAKSEDWHWEVISVDYNDDARGIKSISIAIEGDDVYDKLQFEAGVHRVQRIPITEANGRIHTSTATIAVLPECEDINISINEKYLRTDVYRAGGAGGQHVNKTESAVRVVYSPPELIKPITVSIQDEKSQHKNKAKAMKLLKAKVAHIMQEQSDSERISQRKSQVGTAMRSEKIRTYNFQQNRVTDHRCKLSVYNLQESSLLLSNDLNKIIDALKKMTKNELLYFDSD